MKEQCDENPVPGARARASLRRWREVVQDEGRAHRQRVVPLPLALAALLLPFLAAWATAGERFDGWPGGTGASARALPEPLTALSRDTRLPRPGTGYVDVWGPLAPWEEAHLTRRADRGDAARWR